MFLMIIFGVIIFIIMVVSVFFFLGGLEVFKVVKGRF